MLIVSGCLLLAGCCEGCLSFEEYDYDSHRNAHVDFKPMKNTSIDIEEQHLRLKKKWKTPLRQPTPKIPHPAATGTDAECEVTPLKLPSSTQPLPP